ASLGEHRPERICEPAEGGGHLLDAALASVVCGARLDQEFLRYRLEILPRLSHGARCREYAACICALCARKRARPLECTLVAGVVRPRRPHFPADAVHETAGPSTFSRLQTAVDPPRLKTRSLRCDLSTSCAPMSFQSLVGLHCAHACAKGANMTAWTHLMIRHRYWVMGIVIALTLGLMSQIG